MKRLLAIILSSLMLITLLAACASPDDATSEPPPAPPEETPATDDPTTEPADEPDEPDEPAESSDEVDISEFVELRYLMIGTRQQDHDLIWEMISEITEAEINASITADIIDMGDHETRIPLIIAAQEPYDMMFTAAWAHYHTEAPRGAFAPITQELVERYMPRTWANQPWRHFEYNRIGGIHGNIYMVPASFINLTGNANAVSIREDLRVELGVPPVTDLASLEVFLQAVADNIPGVFPYAATQNNNELKSHLLYTRNNLFQLAGVPMQDFFAFTYTPGMTVAQAADSVRFIGDMPEFTEWAHLVHDWAQRGFWSRSAIADTTMVRDSYENNQSAMFVQNTGTMGMANNAVRALGFDVAMIDLFPTSNRFMGITNAGISVLSHSPNMERALMFIDMLKYDQRVYELLRWGIEDVHWEWVDEATRFWRHGPYQDRYVFGQGSWGFSSPEFEPRNMEGTDVEGVEMFNGWWADHIQTTNPLAAFSFDTQPIETELAALSAVRAQHLFLIDLGHAGDPDEAIAAMIRDAEAAGIERIIDELNRQLAEFVAEFG